MNLETGITIIIGLTLLAYIKQTKNKLKKYVLRKSEEWKEY